MTHPLFDSGVRDYWAKHSVPTSGDETPGRNAVFYHATKLNLDNESHVTPPASRGRSSSGGADNVNWFATSDPGRARRNYGGNVYRVEPTGSFTDNSDTLGQLGGEYESEHPLRILSKMQFSDSGPAEASTPGSVQNRGS